MNASSREEVFSALRAKGIKAIKVVAADGSKANGEVRGLRKRAVVALVALAAAVAGVVSWWWAARAGRAPYQTAATSAALPQSGLSPRHQISATHSPATATGSWASSLSPEGICAQRASIQGG